MTNFPENYSLFLVTNYILTCIQRHYFCTILEDPTVSPVLKNSIQIYTWRIKIKSVTRINYNADSATPLVVFK